MVDALTRLDEELGTYWPAPPMYWHKSNRADPEVVPLADRHYNRQKIAATRFYWPEVPELGMITFVNTQKVKKKRDFGRCYLKAGFKHVGFTKGGLMAFQLLPNEMPPALSFL